MWKGNFGYIGNAGREGREGRALCPQLYSHDIKNNAFNLECLILFKRACLKQELHDEIQDFPRTKIKFSELKEYSRNQFVFKDFFGSVPTMER